eukprot:CAMPEP_0179872136 /NCGR_PEP_ID=MMETSP0982-20121206/21320_1 /TAXON_ID=483367 /ORGANISM="non described non described, Strain CCMP 2436" /LENGTH=320 /DNA_ID=CAMNT_0021763097 /DNA_START=33 /DNA_END=995 /DNA_ORIENTATION=-
MMMALVLLAAPARAMNLRPTFARPSPFNAAAWMSVLASRGDGGGGDGSANGGGGGSGGGGGAGGGDDDCHLPPIGWPLAVPLLHALNKGMLCASVDPALRDLTMRLTDVGFLGMLGGLAALASFSGSGIALYGLQRAIVQVALGHMLLESLVNGLLLPHFRDPEKGAHTRTLRPEMWLHHAFAIVAFSAVLLQRCYLPQAVLLTATECTCALPPSFQEARKAKRATGALSATLSTLLLAAFAGRCAVSLAVIAPTTPSAIAALRELLAGRAAQPAYAAAQGVVWACAVGLGTLNALWFSKILQGAVKIKARGRQKKVTAA